MATSYFFTYSFTFLQMKKTLYTSGVLSLVALAGAVPTASAHFGGRGMGMGMDADHFAEFKAIVSQSADVEAFQTAMQTLREQHQAEREAREAKINRTTENIDNGVVWTMTSDDADIVAEIQERATAQEPRNEDVIRTVELLDNGVRVTHTSDDEDIVARLQEGRPGNGVNRAQGKAWGLDKGMGKASRQNGNRRPQWDSVDDDQE